MSISTCQRPRHLPQLTLGRQLHKCQVHQLARHTKVNASTYAEWKAVICSALPNAITDITAVITIGGCDKMQLLVLLIFLMTLSGIGLLQSLLLPPFLFSGASPALESNRWYGFRASNFLELHTFDPGYFLAIGDADHGNVLAIGDAVGRVNEGVRILPISEALSLDRLCKICDYVDLEEMQLRLVCFPFSRRASRCKIRVHFSFTLGRGSGMLWGDCSFRLDLVGVDSRWRVTSWSLICKVQYSEFWTGHLGMQNRCGAIHAEQVTMVSESLGLTPVHARHRTKSTWKYCCVCLKDLFRS